MDDKHAAIIAALEVEVKHLTSGLGGGLERLAQAIEANTRRSEQRMDKQDVRVEKLDEEIKEIKLDAAASKAWFKGAVAVAGLVSAAAGPIVHKLFGA